MADVPVGHPLTPQTLLDLGAFTSFPALLAGFAPDGDWVNTYSIWTCRGYVNRGNVVIGALRLEHLAGATSGDPFTLIIDQVVTDDDNISNTIHAEAVCSNNTQASLLNWTLTSKFTKNGSPVVPNCDISESGVVTGTDVNVTRNTQLLTRPGSTQLTADWAVFELMQRLPFATPSPALSFDTLEGLSLLKKDHAAGYRGTDSITVDSSPLLMHCFQEIGNGVLPFEYWLDTDHRLLLAVTFARAYILTGSTPPTPYDPETIFETFGDNPSQRGWVNAQAGGTTFAYNASGWLDAAVYRDSSNRALYYRQLANTYDKTAEFWWEMDVEYVSATSNLARCMFGVFNSAAGDNDHDTVADRFPFWYYSGGSEPRGNRNDIYGYDSGGAKLNGNGSPTNPEIPYGQPVRVKGHYWYDSLTDEGRADLAVYAINPNGSTASVFMTAGSVVIGTGKSLTFDRIAVGNRTDSTDSGENNVIKIDNIYFSNVQENPGTILPSFY